MSRLAGVSPGAGAETVLYTPPASKQAAVKVTCANRTSTIVRVRMAVRPGAGPTTSADYVAYDEAIPANDSRISAAIDVANPQSITVETDTTGVTFQANGIERDI